MKKIRKNKLLFLAWAFVAPAFLLSQSPLYAISVDAITTITATTITPEQQAALDKIAKDRKEAEDEAEKIQDKLKKAEKEKAALQQNLGKIQSAVVVTQKKINQSKAVIADTVEAISAKENEVEMLNKKIELQKEFLKSFLQEIYYSQNKSFFSFAFSGGDFLDLYGSADHFQTLNDKVRQAMADIKDTEDQIEADKISLAEAKEQHETVLEKTADVKDGLLATQEDVQQDIESKEAIISKLEKQLVELESDLNALSGKSYNASDIRGAVEDASRETGVPEGVLYGFLKMETNLGANTGKCTYAEVEKVSTANYKKYGSKYKASIALLTKRKNLFYTLVDNLGYDKNKKVSCSPSGYVGQGGAMGIPQFMSDVWQGYSARIASATGHKIPDPWNLTDGVMAMAIKLRGAGATSSSSSAIKKASINYLGTFHAPYYNGIVYWSKNYKLLFQ
jgi:septal ring factor EnvC (AmiA/AmiB activator)